MRKEFYLSIDIYLSIYLTSTHINTHLHTRAHNQQIAALIFAMHNGPLIVHS